jgi:putative transposase
MMACHDLAYPFHGDDLLVTAYGGICMMRKSSPDRGSASKRWRVTCMQYDGGYVDDETCRLEPIANSFGPKVLPPESVTYGSGIIRNPCLRYGPSVSVLRDR